jgi:DNA-binding transcriptional LysR family regulator
MGTIEGMRVFVRVAQRVGFAAAARELRVSPAAVTKQIAALEARVGARLLERTTRRVALTEAGRVYLERCLECLQVFDDAEASVSDLSSEPRGLLRASAPVDCTRTCRRLWQLSRASILASGSTCNCRIARWISSMKGSMSRSEQPHRSTAATSRARSPR